MELKSRERKEEVRKIPEQQEFNFHLNWIKNNETDQTEPHSVFPAQETYLLVCDFFCLAKADWRRVGPDMLGELLSHRPEFTKQAPFYLNRFINY